MGRPLDNPASISIQDVSEQAGRVEPIVEFARKKSPTHAADSFEDIQTKGGRGLADQEFPPLRFADLQEVPVPRDINQPLVTSPERNAQVALEAYKSLRTRLLKSQASRGFRTLAITSVGRAEGKTITAFNLACCCAQLEGLSVLLIDGDLRNRSLTKLVPRLPSVGLADLMSGTASYADAVVRTDMPNLCLMGAGTSSTASTELFSTDRWSEVVRRSRQHFKMVLVDALSMGAFADFELIAPECDGVLIVVRARSTSREALKMAVNQLEPNKLIGMVWNGEEPGKISQLYC